MSNKIYYEQQLRADLSIAIDEIIAAREYIDGWAAYPTWLGPAVSLERFLDARRRTDKCKGLKEIIKAAAKEDE